MNITRAALVNNRTALILLVVLIIVGLQAYQNLPRAYDPGFIIRVAKVITYFPGASPERIEQLITDKLEKVVQEIPELDFIKSTSKTGVSIISVTIRESYTDMRPIWDNLRRKIENAAKTLPDGVIGPEVNDEFGDVFGIVTTLTGPDYSYAELKKIADEARNELLRIPEVAKVEIYGAQEERIFIEYNNEFLSSMELSPTQLMMMLENRNIVVPGGSITLNKERIELEPSGNFESLEDIRHTIIPIFDRNSKDKGMVVYLEDIATIKRGYVDPPSSQVRSSGKQALGLGISMKEGGNNVRMGQQVQSVLRQLNNTYPIGIDFNVINFSPKEVEKKVNDFVSNLLQAVLVVAAVMLIALGPRTGLIVASLIPCSIIAAMLVMSIFHIGLDQISLAALIIALGMLVDNGIVMAESIMVQLNSGKKAMDAAIDSASELRVPLLTSSLTTAAAFLPIYLAESAVGEFTASLFLVVTITLLCSWVLSMTLIPLLCVYVLKAKKENRNYNDGFYLRYRNLLTNLLRHRTITLLITCSMFFVAISGFKYIPKVFFPPSDRQYFTTEVELPLGTAIERTADVVRDIEEFIANELLVNEQRSDGIINWISHIGDGGPRFVLQHSPEPTSPNYALMVINTTSADIIDELIVRLDGYAFEHFPDVQVTSQRIASGTPVKNPIEVRISGNNIEQLFTLVEDLKTQMASTKGLKTISDDWGQRTKKLKVQINQTRALRVGATSQDIALSLQSGLSGLQMTQYREGEDVIPVILRSVQADRQDIGRLESLSVYIQSTGKSITLKQVADIEVVWEPAKVLRRGSMKTVTVGAQLDYGYTASEVFSQLQPWLKQQQETWPVGYRYELGGEAESSGKANQSIGDKLPIAAFIILLLLVAQFNSLRKPVIILATIPLGLIGVIIGLLITQSFFGFMTLLGVISLAGIVINNAIVLLERIKYEIDENRLSSKEAIIVAAQRRLRPILLTTATTVLGMVPLYLGGGEMWEPMAVTIMAGLLFSTFMTLGLVPVLYSVFYRVKY